MMLQNVRNREMDRERRPKIMRNQHCSSIAKSGFVFNEFRSELKPEKQCDRMDTSNRDGLRNSTEEHISKLTLMLR